jgi:hypothetical protein
MKKDKKAYCESLNKSQNVSVSTGKNGRKLETAGKVWMNAVL